MLFLLFLLPTLACAAKPNQNEIDKMDKNEALAILVDEAQPEAMRSQAANRLVALDSKEAIEPMLAVMMTAEAYLIQDLSRALRTLGATQKLAADFQKAEAAKKEMMVPMMMRLGDPKIESVLVRVLNDKANDESPSLHSKILIALGHFALPTSFKAILNKLSSADPKVRGAAAMALGHYTTDESTKALQAAESTEKNDFALSFIEDALKAIKNNKTKNDAN